MNSLNNDLREFVRHEKETKRILKSTRVKEGGVPGHTSTCICFPTFDLFRRNSDTCSRYSTARSVQKTGKIRYARVRVLK